MPNEPQKPIITPEQKRMDKGAKNMVGQMYNAFGMQRLPWPRRPLSHHPKAGQPPVKGAAKAGRRATKSSPKGKRKGPFGGAW